MAGEFMKSGRERKWRTTGIVVSICLAAGCIMSEPLTVKSPVEKGVQEVAKADAPELAMRLDAELVRFLRTTYAIKSVHYYRFQKGIPWVAISKRVQNEMSEKSINRVAYDWEEPGIDFVDVYSQGKNGFAVAMLKDTPTDSEKFVGYYLLKPAK
jgi:hypothetical protein